MMRFETKHLIRWGIPGWVLIFWLIYESLFLKGINPLESNLLDISKGLTVLISLVAIGVPVGYIMHQIYFGFAWVLNNRKNFNEIADKIGDKFPKHDEWGQNKHEDYFQFEYVWHSMLLNQDVETRTYLEGRYRYMLSTIHGLGALIVSSAISLMGTGLIGESSQYQLTNSADFPFIIYLWIGYSFQFIILLSTIFNYMYYSNNLRAFQIKMLKTYL
ncbi:hypothetical protein ACIP97_24345 [Peribacillus frigoritolerans]|uniref:hypothetical protein n=1 Tax=Peribacillus frigoritolerans TaxID=450367 RepID=UPI0037FA2951